MTGIFLAATLGFYFLNAWFSSYVAGKAFEQMVSRQASKGLKVQGQFRGVRRNGFLSASAEHFDGSNDERTMHRLNADSIRATLNPLGFFRRQWRFDDIEIETGWVELQKSRVKPNPTGEAEEKKEEETRKPWYSWMLPSRVYLSEVRVADAEVRWPLRHEMGRIRHLQLKILPHGRDFEYFGHDGTLRMPMVPPLRVAKVQVLITKTDVDVKWFELRPPSPKDDGFLQLKGHAEMQGDEKVSAQTHFEKMSLRPWLPASWRDNASGRFSGDIHWESRGTRLEEAEASGALVLDGLRLQNLSWLNKLAAVTKNQAFRDLKMDRAHFKLRWKNAFWKMDEISLDAGDLLQARGFVQSEDKNLEGKFRIGTSRKNLEWLPDLATDIFKPGEDGLCWTDVQISGTRDQPVQDLTPRITKLLMRHPLAAVGLLLRQLDED